jgi:single-strand DNA-binding protein
MMSLTVGGRLGADPTMGDAGGTAVCNFSVAVDGWDPKAREKMTTWVRVAVFGKRAESLQTILSKGSSVMCAGEARLTEYKGKQYLELTANAVTLMGSKPADAPAPARKAPAANDDPFG